VSRFEPVEFDDVEVMVDSGKSILCNVDGAEVWIPKSQISDESEVYEEGTSGKLIIPRWLAVDRKLMED